MTDLGVTETLTAASVGGLDEFLLDRPENTTRQPEVQAVVGGGFFLLGLVSKFTLKPHHRALKKIGEAMTLGGATLLGQSGMEWVDRVYINAQNGGGAAQPTTTSKTSTSTATTTSTSTDTSGFGAS